MANKITDYAGRTFGRLTAISDSGCRTARGVVLWLCRCSCGNTKLVSGGNLKKSKSCGCANKRGTTHGMKHTPEYRAWSSMRERCLNPNHHAYGAYGGRGITICPQWRDFAVFIADMGKRPDKCSIDRIDNSKGYSPENCRWASRGQQERNKRSNVVINAFNQSYTLVEWSEKTGVPAQTIAWRVRHGWSPEEALTIRNNP